jgi:hypothetical protein
MRLCVREYVMPTSLYNEECFEHGCRRSSADGGFKLGVEAPLLLLFHKMPLAQYVDLHRTLLELRGVRQEMLERASQHLRFYELFTLFDVIVDASFY